ncbi:MAG: MFS transporter [Fimbriimonadaceae bacterium]|nr:MFS transporter [Alphaproteobacteria bacterium]
MADQKTSGDRIVYPGKKAVYSWILYDWAAQPFFTLITTFVFAPFFVTQLAPSPVIGQSYWGYATGAAGLIIAIFSPILGAIADTSGPRKPWIATFSIFLFAGSLALWFAKPDSEAAITIALAAFIVGTIGAEFGIVFTNAMMPSLVPPEKLGRLSGNGWAAGYVGGLVSLVLVLGFMAASPASGLTLLGNTPIWGLDPAAYEGERGSGPFTAIWFAVFVIPLFLFTPDIQRNREFANLAAATKTGWGNLLVTLREIRKYADVFRFLIARMIYADGLIALFAFGGLYGASIFGWTSIELGIFGILLTITGALGAWAGGYIDDAFGSKKVIQLSLILLIISTCAILSIDRESWLFVFESVPRGTGDAPFNSVSERVFLVFGVIIGIAAGPLQASSRTMLIALTPAEKLTQFFGLFALTGKVTSFVGPIAVGAITAISNSQRIGISVLVIFFLIGFAALHPVRVTVR